MSTIQALAAQVPAGGYMATCGPEEGGGGGGGGGGEAGAVTDALTALEFFPIEDYRTLDAATLRRVYETAEDVNWHTTAGLAHQAWREATS